LVFWNKKNDLPKVSRDIIIGDAHGHFDAVLRLLDQIALRNDDRVYFLGDLIDRGPQSKQLVNFVIENHYQCLLGNHEHMLLKAIGGEEVSDYWLQNWVHSGGAETLLSYNNQIPEEHIHWFQSLPEYIDLGKIWLVHAGVDPAYPLEKQTREQFCWIRDEFHAMTQPYFEDKLIITGHTVTFSFPEVQPGKIAQGVGWLDIETGVYHRKSQWLTALDLTHQKIYQVHSERKNSRVLPLEKATVTIDPNQIAERRRKNSRDERR
jgi:serine/threonine protein phosphatase 1